ncbi:MAG: peptidyl-prolyl cis-trans isomerase [Candidatus Magasanikbacteria bacterium]|nr:peptidyl-prolyl cis-trans isomerase [Candidatus Magasanikbacteria bacterium]
MPYLILQQKLDERLASDPAPREALRARAAAVLKQIQAGKDFAELAREFGEDGTAAAGGDLGWFSRGEMVPQFEAAAFALKKGEVTAAPVESPFGYHLIKLEDRETKRGRSADGKPTTTERISARHILFRFASLDRYLDQALKAARLQFYLRLHNPFPG